MPFDYYITHSDKSLYAQETYLKRLMSSGYGLFLLIGTFVLIISIIMIAISILAGGPKGKSEGKSNLPGVLIAGVIMFSLSSIADIILVFAFSLTL